MDTLVMIVKLLPAILKAVIDFEAIIPQSGQGATKLDLIVKGVQVAFTDVLDPASKTIPSVEKVTTFITKYATIAVDVLNKAGIFKTPSTT